MRYDIKLVTKYVNGIGKDVERDYKVTIIVRPNTTTIWGYSHCKT